MEIQWPFADITCTGPWEFEESESTSSILTAEFEMGAVNDEELLDFHYRDGSVRIEAPGGVAGQARSVGVRTAEHIDCRIVRFCFDQPLDCSRRTRSFGAQAALRTPICELPGFREAFANVPGIDALDLPVCHVTRFGETNRQFLRRLSALCGKRLVGGAIQAQQPPATPLSRALIIDRSTAWSVGAIEQRRGAIVWSEETGAINSAADPADEGDSHALASAAIGLPALPPDGAGALAMYPFDHPEPQLAAAVEASQTCDRAFEFSCAVRDPRIAVGQIVKLPKGFAFAGEDLRVAARRLSFDGRRGEDQLQNRLTLKPASGLAKPDGDFDQWRLVKAKVVHLNDSQKLGLVAVQLPWQAEGEFLWATNLQPTTNAYAAPAVGDRVVLLMQPYSFSRPIVLGAVFRGDNGAPTASGETLVRWRLVGCEIRYDNQSKILTIAFDGGLTIEIDARSMRVRGDFDLLGGNFNIKD